MTDKRYLGFAIPDDLREEIEELLEKLNVADDKSKYALDIYKIVQELSHVGLDYYFTAPLKKAKIGRFMMKSIQVAINTGKKGIFAVAKRILKSMDDKQLDVVVELLENSLTVHPDDLEDA